MSSTTTNTLYLVRHGENPANITKEFSYKIVDYSLTPKGVLQAEQTATFFKHIPLDAIYSSPLKRALETARAIAEPQHLPVTILEELREVNIGRLEGKGLTQEEIRANWKVHNRVIREWIKGNHTETFPGGENFIEHIGRARLALLKATQGRSNQHIVLSSHGGLLSAMVRAFCSASSPDMVYTTMGNCAITEIELTTSGEEVNGLLRSWSSTAHLSGLAAQQVSPHLEDEAISA